MKIIKASEYNENPNINISKIFVDGFHQWLRFFSKDKNKLVLAFSHMFNLDTFYISVIDCEIAGIAAFSDGSTPTVHLDKKELKKYLGLFKGTISYYILRKEFENKKYPIVINKDMGFVEFVATSINHRNKGAASEIIKHIFNETPSKEYVLEVADTNTHAVNLYNKLGFKEIYRIKQKHSKQSGINYLVYLKYQK